MDVRFDDRQRKLMQRSLLSVMFAAVAITFNHYLVLGIPALGVGALIVATSFVFGLSYLRTGARWAFYGYSLVNLWVVAAFGLYGGLWNGAVRVGFGSLLASMSDAFPPPAVGSALFEASVMVMLAAAFVYCYFWIRLLESRGANLGARSRPASRLRSSVVAASIVVCIIGMCGVYAFSIWDRWQPPSEGIVRIAVIAPVGGPFELLGGSFIKAVELAKDELTGKAGFRYELVVIDPGPDPKRAREIIQKAIAERPVAAILGAVSTIGEVTQHLSREARIPHLCVCTVRSIGDGAYRFTNIPLPEAEASLWVREARARNISSVAILAQDYPSIRNHVEAVKQQAVRSGIAVVSERYFAGDARDFRPLLAATTSISYDALYVEALQPALDILGAQIQQAGIRRVTSVVTPSLSHRPELFEGAWYTDSNLADAGFVDRFQAKYPGTRFATHMMPYAYDNVAMIVDAFERHQNPAAYIRGLASYDGAAGRVTKPQGSGNFCSAPAVWEIRNGKPILLHQLAPEDAVHACRDAAAQRVVVDGFVH
jgi:ABC-type branched-subunit amino acid transport system substrate-binding protein